LEYYNHNLYNTKYLLQWQNHILCLLLGKGENIWDHLVHNRPELIKDKTNGDIACDSYHKYKEDIALAKHLNVNILYFVLIYKIVLIV
jgi:hypothetical protein